VLVALLLTAAPLAVAWLVAVPPILLVSRWYFRRAPTAYRAEMASYAAVNASVAETVDAGRTIETYRLGGARVAATDDRIRTWTSWEQYTLSLRSVFFPSVEAAYVLPLACVLALGGYLYIGDHLTLAQVTAGVLYTQMLIEPVDLVLMWYDELQVGQASLARLLGVREVPPAQGDPDAQPHGDDLAAHDVRFGYREGHDVLHGVDLDVAPGRRVAVVGPSGAGKSTLGRLLAGVHAPREGTVRLGGSDLASLSPEQVRRHVVLVTQEHHVFVGTLRDNLLLARPDATDDEVAAALAAVDADWWADLPEGMGTKVGAGGYRLTPAQAQQVALARLVLADPHTLVLDEATSLLDPRAARHLERSLSAVLEGRTVVAVAHRLHTAHDADTIVVMEQGRITEHGSHDELVARGGAYAALWESWRAES
jgi:ABC-type multidrug transport system fused ATPase/permease subunit